MTIVRLAQLSNEVVDVPAVPPPSGRCRTTMVAEQDIYIYIYDLVVFRADMQNDLC